MAALVLVLVPEPAVAALVLVLVLEPAVVALVRVLGLALAVAALVRALASAQSAARAPAVASEQLVAWAPPVDVGVAILVGVAVAVSVAVGDWVGVAVGVGVIVATVAPPTMVMLAQSLAKLSLASTPTEHALLVNSPALAMVTETDTWVDAPTGRTPSNAHSTYPVPALTAPDVLALKTFRPSGSAEETCT
jgi:hypothetical protein